MLIFALVIQRIQSIYLLIASGLCFALLVFESYKSTLMTLVVFIAGLMDLINVFLYKDRATQIKMGKLNILIGAVLLFGSAYMFHRMGMDVQSPGFLVPITMILLSVVMIVMANQSIKKDDDLVKSADRLR